MNTRILLYCFALVISGNVICTPLFAQRVLSDQEFWQPIAQLPSRPSDITSAFAGTDSALFVSNNAGVLRSSDNGATWQPSSLYDFSRGAVAASGKTVYAAPSISLDGGSTWSTLLLTSGFATVCGAHNGQFIVGSNAGVFRFSGDGSNMTTILSSTLANCTALAISERRVFIGASNGRIFYTGDAFAPQVSWGTANLPVQNIYDITFRSTSDGMIFICAATNQGVWYSSNFTTWQKSSLADETYDMCVSGTTFFAGTSTNGVFRSTDNGVTWQQTSLRALPINVLDSFKGRIFAGTLRNGIYYSDDNGTTWQSASVPESPINGTIHRFGTSYVVLGEGQLYSSPNSGRTWKRGTIPSSITTTILLPLSASRLLLGTSANGIQYSRNSGTDWLSARGVGTAISSIVASGNLLLAACPSDGVYRSNDSGETWSKIYPLANQTRPILHVNGSVLYMINDFSLFGGFRAMRSLDSGRTWQEMNTGTNVLTSPLAFQGNTILGFTFQGTLASMTLLRSNNGGDSWTTQMTNQRGLRNFVTAGQWIYATSILTHGVFASSDTGKTWSQLTSSKMQNIVTDENNFILSMLGNTVVRSIRNATTSIVREQDYFQQSQQVLPSVCRPNPTTDFAEIVFPLSQSAQVAVTLYSALGMEVWRSESTFLPAGEQRLRMDVRGLPTGVYAYRLTVGGVQSVGRLVVAD